VINPFTLDRLRRARRLITDPRYWTQGAYARNIQGDECAPDEPPAFCFCTYGALARATGCRPFEVSTYAGEALDALVLTLNEDFDDMPIASIPEWNDNSQRTHADVLALFDKTIERLEKEVRHGQ